MGQSLSNRKRLGTGAIPRVTTTPESITMTRTIPIAEASTYGASIGQYLTQWIGRDGQSSLYLGVGQTEEEAEGEADAEWARQGLPDADGRYVTYLVVA